jgi:hypothetical protein
MLITRLVTESPNPLFVEVTDIYPTMFNKRPEKLPRPGYVLQNVRDHSRLQLSSRMSRCCKHLSSQWQRVNILTLAAPANRHAVVPLKIVCHGPSLHPGG